MTTASALYRDCARLFMVGFPGPRIDPEKHKFSDSYRITAFWLAWVSKKYDMRLVPALDLALRKAEDPMPIFAKMTGKGPDELWKEFLDSKP